MGTLGPAPPYLFLLFPELYHFSSLVLAVLALAFALALSRALSLLLALSFSFLPLPLASSYYVLLAGLELSLQTILASNSQRFSCLCLPTTEISGKCHLTRLSRFFLWPLT